MSVTKMATYVFIHGGNMSTETWNDLTVGKHVQTQDERRDLGRNCIVLTAHNHRVFAPTLKDECGSTLTEHIEQICALITENDLKEVILVGHSYGGVVITGVAATMPDRISRLVYVDAALPDPGQSLFDIIVSSGNDPMSFVGLEPAAPYVEKLQFDPKRVKPIPKTYIMCTESEFSPVHPFVKKKIEAAGTGWDYVKWPTSHVPMASMPEQFNELLLEIAKNGS